MSKTGSPLAESTEAVTPADLVATASEMVPRLRARSAECESLRKLHPDTVAEIRAAGFPRIA